MTLGSVFEIEKAGLFNFKDSRARPALGCDGTFTMSDDLQDLYDDAMFDFSTGDYDSAIGKFGQILVRDPSHFDAQLSLGMAHYRKGDYATAIAEGHKAEKLRPKEQLVHTNLSLFYMRSGDKKTAEHHGLQARIASWRDNMAPPPGGAVTAGEDELKMAGPPKANVKVPEKFPDMPWKKKPAGDGSSSSSSGSTPLTGH